MARGAAGPRAASPRVAKGLTLIELSLSLAVTAVIGTAIASMLFGVTRGADDRDELRRRNAMTDVACLRLDAVLRSSAMVLALGVDHVVLWVEDADGDGRPRLSEIRRVDRDAATKQVQSYAAPATLAPADDAVYQLTDDLDAITRALRGTASFASTTVLENVTAWRPSGPAGVPTLSLRIVSYALTIEDARGPLTVRSAAALRATIHTLGE